MFAFASHSRLRGALPPWWFAVSLRCTPLQRLRASRYSGGVAFLLHQEGWGLHPTSGHQLSALTERCHSSPSMFCWFRVNGSHLLEGLAHGCRSLVVFVHDNSIAFSDSNIRRYPPDSKG